MNVQEVGYESDVTVYQDDHESDYDIVIDEKSDTDDSNLARYIDIIAIGVTSENFWKQIMLYQLIKKLFNK